MAGGVQQPHQSFSFYNMKNVALKRLIHISDLYRDVCDWLGKQNGEGFFKLTPDVVELFAAADPDWKEMDWLDAMDQFVYADYLLRKNEGGGGVSKKTATRQDLKNHENQVNLDIRSCEDDFCNVTSFLLKHLHDYWCSEVNSKMRKL